MARRHGVEAIDLDRRTTTSPSALRELTDGRGPDSVIDAVGMEAHGAPVGKLAQNARRAAARRGRRAADREGRRRPPQRAATPAIDAVRRGGTVSISGVYGGAVDPMPMMQLFDKQVQLRMGQANVKRWIDDILPLVTDDDDPLGVERLRHPPAAARRGARRLRDVPEEAGRRDQGRVRSHEGRLKPSFLFARRRRRESEDKGLDGSNHGRRVGMEASKRSRDWRNDDVRFATYEFTQVRRVALHLRSTAAELEQMRPETDTPSDRHRCVSACLHRLHESEELLARMAESLNGARQRA